MAVILSPFCCMISTQVVTSFRIPDKRSPIWMKPFGSRKCIQEKHGYCTSKVHCECVRFFSVSASSYQQSLYLHPKKRRSKLDPSLISGTKTTPCNSCTLRPPAIQKGILDMVSEKMSPKQLASGASRFSSKFLPTLVLTLSTVLVSQPAYADFKQIVLPEHGVQMEVISSREPSVEAILAKQLAHRFREMSDEELIDILQQLLKASRSSLSSESAIDGGNVPEDLVNEKESREIDMNSSDSNTEINVKGNDTIYGTLPANGQGENVDESMCGEAPLPRAENASGQLDKRTSDHEKGKVCEQQGQDLQKDETPLGKNPDEVRFSEIQRGLGGGKAASIVPPTAKLRPADASVRSKLSVSDSHEQMSAAELSSSKPERDAKEDENFMALLWAEWSRRVIGQVVQDSQTSSTFFSFEDFWQNAHSYSRIVVMKVVASTSFVFSKYKGVGIVAVWSLLIMLAFYLGRIRASSQKDASESRNPPTVDQGIPADGMPRGILEQRPTLLPKTIDNFQDSGGPARIFGWREVRSKGKRVLDEGIGGGDYKAISLPTEGESSIKGDQWWKRPMGESFLVDKNKSLACVPSTFNQSVHYSIPGASGTPAPELNNLPNPSRDRSRRRLTSSVGRGSVANGVIMFQREQLKGSSSREKPVVSSKASLNPSTVSVKHLDTSSSELQISGSQPDCGRSQSQRQSDRPDVTVQDTGDFASKEEKLDQGKPCTSHCHFASTLSDYALIDSFDDVNFDFGRATSAIPVVNATESTGTRRNVQFQMVLPGQTWTEPTERLEGRWEKTATTMFAHKDLDSYEEVTQTRGLEGARELDGRPTSWSKSQLNSFIHDHVLWVRDGDGVFIEHVDTKEGSIHL